jgi:hypothetical protein
MFDWTRRDSACYIKWFSCLIEHDVTVHVYAVKTWNLVTDSADCDVFLDFPHFLLSYTKPIFVSLADSQIIITAVLAV